MSETDTARLAAIRERVKEEQDRVLSQGKKLAGFWLCEERNWLLALAERQAAEIDRLRAAMGYIFTSLSQTRGQVPPIVTNDLADVAREALREPAP